jgi:hypothetical protein
MHGTVRHRVQLQITSQNAMRFTSGIKLENTGKEARALQLLRQFDRIEGNHNGVFFVAVDNGGDAS